MVLVPVCKRGKVVESNEKDGGLEGEMNWFEFSSIVV